MKIDRIACSQFAGLRDRELDLQEGLNVICGPNESGKSSMVNLLSSILFQNSKLDGRRDKDFKRNYFPVQKMGSDFAADFIDGELRFHTAEGQYKLQKEWGNEANVSLTSPEGKIKTENKINLLLKDILIYGEGVYRDMLFSSQKNAVETLKTLLNTAENSDAKKEVAEAAAQAFSETDGFSADAIAEAIQKKVDDLSGKHWDIEKGQPARKSGRWTSGLGEVHKAYYKLDDAKENLDNIRIMEKAAEDAAIVFNEKENEEKQAGDKYENFIKFSAILAAHSVRSKRIKDIEDGLRKLNRILEGWPGIEEELDNANRLNDELNKRKILDKFENARKAKEKLESVDSELLDAECPESGVITELKRSQSKINKLENKLCGMNISAAVKLLGGAEMEITSLRTGENIAITEGNASISEAVKISIPGVMEMELSPADVNAGEIAAQIDAEKKPLELVFKKYEVSTVEELEELRQKVNAAKDDWDKYSDKLELILDGDDYDSLKAQAESIGNDIRSEKEINFETAKRWGRDSAANIAVAKETVIEGYKEEYGSIDGLKAKCFDQSRELEKLKGEAEAEDDIPEEYKNISDPEEYLKKLKKALEDKRKDSEDARERKSVAETKLETYNENLISDPAEDVLKAERELEQQKELLRHWLHIQKVFIQQKENIQNNPMEELAQRFTYNLKVISGGKVRTEFEDEEKLSPGIYSDDKPMDYDKLSEGTKESVSLAFRLAVLDQLFPEGGGIIVFDDPFTDMDPGRMERSAELIKESSERHQIIFLTCREEYAELLSDNIINI